jgi:predicted nucleic-acid-binding protein
MVSKAVVLEVEWVMRGYYGFSSKDISTVLRHLLGLRHLTVEDRYAVDEALANCDAGIDFADALHHASCRACTSFATFDAHRFAQRTTKLPMAPTAKILADCPKPAPPATRTRFARSFKLGHRRIPRMATDGGAGLRRSGWSGNVFGQMISLRSGLN